MQHDESKQTVQAQAEKRAWEPITVKTYRAADAEIGAGALPEGSCAFCTS